MKKIYVIISVLLFTLASCTDNFEDYNTDKKNPVTATGEALFSNGTKELVDQISSTNVNQNIWKLWAQYWTETTYTDEANYDIVNRNVPQQIYRYYFREALKDLKEAAIIINAEVPETPEAEIEKANKLNIIELLNAYAYQRLVDIFGMVPYSEALNIENVYPVYEKGEDIYADLISRVNAALAGLNPAEGSFGSADLLYGGDVAAWIKFGNSLKIKLGITIADYNSSLAQSTIEDAVAECFTSADDNCLFSYQGSSPNQNPLYEDMVASGRDDFVPANTLVDMLNGLADPRADFFFDPSTKVDTSSEEGVVKMAYLGGTYGYSSPFAQHSHVSTDVTAPTFKGILLTYSEVQFYLAEAAERGYTVPNSAEEYYNEGITASFAYWGAPDVENYLAKPEVAYATAASTWQEKIATQSWIASYTRGFVGYTTWRRLDYPVFNIAQQITDYSEIPTRFTFPINEQTLNGENYDAAAAAIGGDKLTTKIFWDVY